MSVGDLTDRFARRERPVAICEEVMAEEPRTAGSMSAVVCQLVSHLPEGGWSWVRC